MENQLSTARLKKGRRLLPDGGFSLLPICDIFLVLSHAVSCFWSTTAQLGREALNKAGKPSLADSRRISKIVSDLMGWGKAVGVTIAGYNPKSRGFTRR